MILLDTTILSLLVPSMSEKPLLPLYGPDLKTQPWAVALQTVGELHKGAQLAGWAPRRWERTERTLGRCAIFAPGATTARLWGTLLAHPRTLGRKLSAEDAWIAATAAQHKIPLLSHDQDLTGLGFPDLDVICRA